MYEDFDDHDEENDNDENDNDENDNEENEENEENEDLYISSDTTSSTMDMSDLSYMSDSEIDEMFDYDVDFNDTEKIDGRYYIGLCNPMFNGNYMFTSSISPSLFMHSRYHSALRYLHYNSIIVVNVPQIEILQLYIENHSYYVIKKTFWLRIVQRTWKRVLKERANIIKKRCSLTSILYFQMYGKYPREYMHLPTLQGMLQLMAY